LRQISDSRRSVVDPTVDVAKCYQQSTDDRLCLQRDRRLGVIERRAGLSASAEFFSMRELSLKTSTYRGPYPCTERKTSPVGLMMRWIYTIFASDAPRRPSQQLLSCCRPTNFVSLCDWISALSIHVGLNSGSFTSNGIMQCRVAPQRNEPLRIKRAEVKRYQKPDSGTFGHRNSMSMVPMDSQGAIFY